MGRVDVPGHIYILHFDPPFKQAKHYTGWTEREPDERYREHITGVGSKLVWAAVRAGCVVTIARIFPGTRNDERRIKQRRNTPRTVCPICKAANNANTSIG